MALEQALYAEALRIGDDIRQHLPTLRWLAGKHDRITEFGVRAGASTIALLSGNPRLVSYDVDRSANHDQIAGVWPDWQFHQESTLECVIAETDMLFVDTLHTYEQLSAELARHAGKVAGTIVLHDLYVAASGPENDAVGMQKATREFLEVEGWELVFDTPFCNGLTVLCRS